MPREKDPYLFHETLLRFGKSLGLLTCWNFLATFFNLNVGILSLNCRVQQGEPCTSPVISGVEELHLSNETRAPGCLGYLGDYTHQLYRDIRDYEKPL